MLARSLGQLVPARCRRHPRGGRCSIDSVVGAGKSPAERNGCGAGGGRRRPGPRRRRCGAGRAKGKEPTRSVLCLLPRPLPSAKKPYKKNLKTARHQTSPPSSTQKRPTTTRHSLSIPHLPALPSRLRCLPPSASRLLAVDRSQPSPLSPAGGEEGQNPRQERAGRGVVRRDLSSARPLPRARHRPRPAQICCR